MTPRAGPAATGARPEAVRGRWRFWAVAYAMAAVLAAANLPTPLYPHYQNADHLSTATLTVVFAAYVVTVGGTLSMAGQASDLFGRRAILVPALSFGLVSAACFATSGALGWLLAGRIASGVASGAVTAAGPATLVDLEPGGDVDRASTAASTAIVGGLAVGPIISGVFVRYAPWPDHLVYVVFLAVLAAGLAGVAVVPAGSRDAPATVAARLRRPAASVGPRRHRSAVRSHRRRLLRRLGRHRDVLRSWPDLR